MMHFSQMPRSTRASVLRCGFHSRLNRLQLSVGKVSWTRTNRQPRQSRQSCPRTPLVWRGFLEGYKIEFPDGIENRLRYRLLAANESASATTTYGIPHFSQVGPGRTALSTSGQVLARWQSISSTGRIQSWRLRMKLGRPCSGTRWCKSVRADLCRSDVSLAALHANVARQQGVQAALMAVLDFSAGGGRLDPVNNLPVITVDFV